MDDSPLISFPQVDESHAAGLAVLKFVPHGDAVGHIGREDVDFGIVEALLLSRLRVLANPVCDLMELLCAEGLVPVVLDLSEARVIGPEEAFEEVGVGTVDGPHIGVDDAANLLLVRGVHSQIPSVRVRSSGRRGNPHHLVAIPLEFIGHGLHGHGVAHRGQARGRRRHGATSLRPTPAAGILAPRRPPGRALRARRRGSPR